MACGYGKDFTLNAELLYRAQLVKCCTCSLLRWGLRMYSSVLNIRSSSTAPGTITITNSATFTHSPNLSRAPKRVASPQNSLAERGACCSVLNTHANWVCNLGSTACLRAELLCSLHSYFFNHAAALSLWLLLISWHAMFCFLHWKVAGQMLQ